MSGDSRGRHIAIPFWTPPVLPDQVCKHEDEEGLNCFICVPQHRVFAGLANVPERKLHRSENDAHRIEEGSPVIDEEEDDRTKEADTRERNGYPSLHESGVDVNEASRDDEAKCEPVNRRE